MVTQSFFAEGEGVFGKMDDRNWYYKWKSGN